MTTRHKYVFGESVRIRLDVDIKSLKSALLLARCVCEAPVSDSVLLPGVIVSGVLGRDGAGTGGYLVGLGSDSRQESAALRLLGGCVDWEVPTTKDRLL